MREQSSFCGTFRSFKDPRVTERSAFESSDFPPLPPPLAVDEVTVGSVLAILSPPIYYEG